MWETIDNFLASAWRFVFGTYRDFRDHINRLAVVNKQSTTIQITNVFWSGWSLYRYRLDQRTTPPAQPDRSHR